MCSFDLAGIKSEVEGFFKRVFAPEPLLCGAASCIHLPTAIKGKAGIDLLRRLPRRRPYLPEERSRGYLPRPQHGYPSKRLVSR